MHSILKFNEKWYFSKTKSNYQQIRLPHILEKKDDESDNLTTFNYRKCFSFKDSLEDKEVYLSFDGINKTADVILNSKVVAHLNGGHFRHRCNITKYIKPENYLEIRAINDDLSSPCGLYRGVDLIVVNKTHFDLDFYGGDGICISSEVEEDKALVNVEAYVTNGEGKEVSFIIANKKQTAIVIDNVASTQFIIDNPHLWDGVDDPYLYTLKARVEEDVIAVNFGIRNIDARDYYSLTLNEKTVHLEFADLTNLDHNDLENSLIKLINDGSTSIILNDYNINSEFLNLCDKHGLIIFAALPKNADNKEEIYQFVIQNYNHPSLATYCVDESLANNLCELIGKLDFTRNVLNLE